MNEWSYLPLTNWLIAQRRYMAARQTQEIFTVRPFYERDYVRQN